MAFYTSSVRTNIHDPHTFVANRYVEFRLGERDACYLSNMRIANLQAVLSTATTKPLNYVNGVYPIIRSMTLFDGQTQLCQQNQFPRWSFFQALRSTSDNNLSLNLLLSGTSLGRTIDFDLTGNTDSPQVKSKLGGDVRDDSVNSFQGWLDVKRFLPLLQVLPYLSTKVFKNLRLVLELDDEFMKNRYTDPITITKPILITDEMTDPSVKNKLLKQMKSVDYVELEHDQYTIDAISGLSPTNKSVVQKTTRQLRGFNNKLVNRMCFQFEPTGGTDQLLDKLGSHHLFRLKTNVILNGRSLLTGSGISSPSEGLSHTSDIWGTITTMGNKGFYPQNTDGNDLVSTDEQTLMKNVDFRCFRLNEQVKTLEFEFERTGVFDASEENKAIAGQLVVHAFGEVNKRLQVNSDGTYLIGYL